MSDTPVAVYEFRGYIIVREGRKVFLNAGGEPSERPFLFFGKAEADTVIERSVHRLLAEDWRVVQVDLSWA